MIDHGRFNILGILIDAIDYEAAVDRILTAAQAGKPLSVSALAVHGVMTGVLDQEQAYRLNHLDLLVPDGQPVRWALNWLYRCGLADRVYGPTLMLKICDRVAQLGLPIALYGSKPEVLKSLADNLKQKFPELQILDQQPSRFRQVSVEEQLDIASQIRHSGAKLVFVGLGCPRQEVWVYENRDLLGMPAIAVGAAFDFHAGLLSQAPKWMQDRGLEWFFRLLKEPSRLWRRYLLLNPLYISLLLCQAYHFQSISSKNLPSPRDSLRYG
ncbi:WecB/TagA/CpsF family glycosyltransferase [Lyngbya confervoides]|uniref:WecB/TagA/CpsF family glycosyltransferase n=1 Tax=Lyngbya confervoides BDU141951 TaxID=1574623 RepID=A0ABD4T8L2_9CYAN|nr:WecB/TagA/CpsF family glycosyltransferase [Lyngbya confervoides]MCM1985149.1 WecB/TagA/CpsF family glycosyltransferase [Lyngbya confervoides BDU141951]